jgi:hypothetical protein
VQGGSSADGLELVGDDDRLVGFAGAAPLRLLAERTGLRAGLSAAMTRPGFHPVYDRGQLLIDLALTQILGGEAISDFQGLRHMAPLIGPVPSTPTVWRALAEVGQLQLTRVNAAVARFRRRWWGLLADRPEGFPWLSVAGRELTGITVLDLDASVVFAASEKENAAPTDKGGVGFCPNLATCDNTDDVLAIDPRAGNATSNCAKDNIAVLDLAVSRLPGRYRRRVLVRLDGAGFSHDLLEHIAAGGGVRGRDWQFSVGWSCTDTEMDAIAQLPRDAWEPGIDQDGDLVEDTFVADLTGLLDLDSWRQKIPGLRILVRDEPLHPRYRKRATDREKQLGPGRPFSGRVSFESDLGQQRLARGRDVGVGVHEVRRGVDVVVARLDAGVPHVSGQVGQHRGDVCALPGPPFDVGVGEVVAEVVRSRLPATRRSWDTGLVPDAVEHLPDGRGGDLVAGRGDEERAP